MSYFGGRKDAKQSTREAIVGLRQQLQMIEKKEEYTMKRIEEEQRKARANVTTNRNGMSCFTKYHRTIVLPWEGVRLSQPKSFLSFCYDSLLYLSMLENCALTFLYH